MTFSDIFRKSFLEGFIAANLSLRSIAFVMLITCIFAAYIFFVYRLVVRKTFYDKNFNIAVAVVAIIVASIILAIQSSIVISLGMVGALSIVRFRTAIKSPLDLIFLFWSISVGIICGAGLPGIAFLASAAITVGIFIFDMMPVAKAPMLLLVNATQPDKRNVIVEKVTASVAACNIKSQVVEENRLDIIFEVRIKNDSALLDEVSAIEGVKRCSLISHDGEVTF